MVLRYKNIHAFDNNKTMKIIYSMYRAGEVSVHRACCERATQPYSLGGGGTICPVSRPAGFTTCCPRMVTECLLTRSMLIKMYKGHLCLWREDSLKEKCNTKYYKIYFYAIFRACKAVSMDKSIYLASFTLVEAPYLAGINIRDALLQNIMAMTIYCTFYFYSHTS